MATHLLIVDRRADFKWAKNNLQAVTTRDYITRPDAYRARAQRVINLSRSYTYLGYGYYSSLLAEARGDKIIPSVKTILDLSQKSIYRFALPELDELLRRRMRRLTQRPETSFSLYIFFGYTDDRRFRDLARKTFDLFRCPMLKVQMRLKDDWSIASIQTMDLDDLQPEQEADFEKALEAYTRTGWREPVVKRGNTYSMAILHNPREAMAPSNARALQKFVRAGEGLGMEVEMIEAKDYLRLTEFDALFIRETTALDHHTYRFAKKAEKEGLPVMDDPNSILKCTNKVYLAELLKANGLPAPRTLIIDKSRLALVPQQVDFPIVFKIPDGSFSRGIYKVHNRDELEATAEALFEESDVILAQEYMFTAFDWRVVIVNNEPIVACQYMMAKNHWKAVRHSSIGARPQQGAHRTLLVEETPRDVLDLAIKAAGLIGDGLYGVDIKENDNGLFVMEINDNPNLDAGIEDQGLKDELYRIILRDFIRRIEQSPRRETINRPELIPSVSLPVSDSNLWLSDESLHPEKILTH